MKSARLPSFCLCLRVCNSAQQINRHNSRDVGMITMCTTYVKRHYFIVYSLLPPHLGCFCWHKIVPECPHGKFHSVPQFVAEMTVAQDAADVQVDVSP